MYSLDVVEVDVRLQSHLDTMAQFKMRILVMEFPDIVMELTDILKSGYYGTT